MFRYASAVLLMTLSVPSLMADARYATAGPSATAVETVNWTAGVSCTYDAAGNIRQIGNDRFVYDQVGRLVQAEINGVNRAYEYDAFGNRKDCKHASGTAIESNCQFGMNIDSSSNRVGGVKYDGAGNVETFSGHVYSYDAVNMPTRDDRGGGLAKEFIYTADDERIATYTVGSTWNWTIRDVSGKILREFTSSEGSAGPGTGSWSWTRDNIFRGGFLLATRHVANAAPVTYHYHLDHLGTPRRVTDQDDRTVGLHDYYAFGPEVSGGLTEPAATSLQYTGHERDKWSGVEGPDTLDYMHARYYNPAMGRFLSVDPKLNLKRALRQPQNWNRYSYVMNSPVRYTDPTGEDVSIGLSFSGDSWTDEEKKQILAQVTQWYQKQNVGKVYIFDSAKQSHGRFLGNLLRGHTTISVTSGTGTGAHKPGMVYAGNYFNDKSLSAAQAIRATSNTIIHETAAHKFGSTYLNGQDQLFYLRNIAIAQQDAGLRARYGTVADSYAFDAADTRGNVTNGLIPIDPGDLRSLQQYLQPKHAEPPEDD